ncbi:synaptonemal complex central element protein 3 [Pundamilia nyererei]|uniref:Synaptonemal complex central element protein 3 n=1 Tax=Pundamilia nyererei TaxID=303518 RepID=A0A3B4EQD7_9CICH|nr:PREDICTED: synaptonemal complex central element protein 3 [Pundamilia nyererei]
MADSSTRSELPRISDDDMLAMNKELERMIEDVESMSAHLTWMAYDMVALRTSPELGASMQKLKEAYLKCRAAVCRDPDQESQIDKSAETAVTTLSQM